MPLILFDFDGTLVDTVPAFAAAVQAAGSWPVNGSVSTKRIQQMVAEASSYAEVFDLLSEACSEQTKDADAPSPGAVEEAFLDAYPTHGKLYPGVYRLLMALENRATCGLVGSAPPDLLDEMIDYFGLDGYFAHTVSAAAGESSIRERTDAWTAETGTALEDAMCVSSRGRVLEWARGWGMRTVFTAYGYGSDPSFPVDHRLDRISRLLQLLS